MTSGINIDPRAAVADSFDPYFEWLGIESGSQPPDHYRLLGLKQFESDTELIGRAADAAMAKVRRIRPGVNLTEWSQMLDRLGATKTCLLDPASKQAYDASLTEGPQPQPTFTISTSLGDLPLPTFDATMVEERPRSPFPVGYSEPPVYADVGAGASPPPEPLAADDWAPIAIEEPISISPIVVQPAPITVPAGKSSGRGPIIALVASLAVALGGLFVYMMLQRDRPAGKGELAADSSASTERPAVESAKPQAEAVPPAKSDVAKPKPAKPKKQVEKPKPEPKEPEPAKMEIEEVTGNEPDGAKPKNEEPKKSKPQIDAAKTAAFAEAVKNVRASLAERDLSTADKDLKTASANAQTREDLARIDRLQTMIENLTQFWNGIRTSMPKLQAAEELVVNGTRISVIESDRDSLTVRIEGQNRRFQVPTLPTSIVMLLVNQYFGKDPGSRAVIGTFLAVDPKGDRALAKQYLQEAAKAGFDSGKVLRELGLDGSSASAAATETPADKAAGDTLEQKMAALEEAMKTARSQANHRDVVQTALTLVEQAVGEQRMDEAERLATLAVEAARKSKNATLLRQATTIRQQVQAMQKKESKDK